MEEYRDFKKVLNYRESSKIMKNELYAFLYNNKDILNLDFKNIDNKLVNMYKLAYTSAWRTSEKYFQNANAAEILDINLDINYAINTLRLQKKSANSSCAYKAFSEAIDIVKDCKAKIPKKIIRL